MTTPKSAQDFDEWWFRNAPPHKRNDEFFRAMASANPEYGKAKEIWTCARADRQELLSYKEDWQAIAGKANLKHLVAGRAELVQCVLEMAKGWDEVRGKARPLEDGGWHDVNVWAANKQLTKHSDLINRLRSEAEK